VSDKAISNKLNREQAAELPKPLSCNSRFVAEPHSSKRKPVSELVSDCTKDENRRMLTS
jgi:hypothetical protein